MDDQLLLNEQDAAAVDRHMRQLPPARRRPAARVGVLGPDRAEAGPAQQAELRRRLAHRPEVQLREPRPRRAVGRRARAQGDDLDHHARAALGDGRTRASTTGSGSRSRTSSPCSRARSPRATGPQADQFAILNEPNQPGWLQPQSTKRGYYAPHLYRRLVLRGVPRDQGGQPGRHDPRRRARRQRQREPRPRLLDPPARVPARVRLRVALVPQAPLGPLPQLQGPARGRDRPPPVQLLRAAVAPLAPTATTPRWATGGGCSGSSTGS